jgi:tetratricopeptide (TPR) repeat protein
VIRRLAVSVLPLLRRPHHFLGALLLLGLTGLAIWFAIASLVFEYHFQKARSALAADQFDLAKEHIANCLRSSPESGRTHFLAAQIARRSGDLKVAERQLADSQRLLNFTDDIALERSMLVAQKGEVDSVEFQLRPKIRQGHPQAARILEAMAKGYLRVYRFLEADSCLQEWLTYEPSSSEAYFLLGWELQQRGDKPGSTGAFKRSLKLDPGNTKVRYQLALGYLDDVQPDEAIPHLEILAKNQPNNVEVLVNLARCQHALGQVDEARVILDSVLDLQPTNSAALIERGLLANNTESPVVAEKYLKEALAFDEFNPQANFAYHKCLEGLGKDKEAAEQRDKIKRIDQDLYHSQELLTRLIPSNPANAVFHAEAGIILLRLGNDEEGERMLYRALKLAPGLESAQNALLEHFQKKKDFKKLARLKEAIDTGSAIDMAVPF